MTDLESSLRRIVTALTTRHAAFAVVGGLAVSARAEPRLTRDADLAVAVTGDSEAEHLVRSLQTESYQVLAAVEQAAGRLATVRLSDGPANGVVTDLLFESCGIESEIVAGAEVLEILAGLVVPVGSVGHLVAMKLLARDDRRRPTDADDLASLRLIAVGSDWEVAGEAVTLIEERGFARGRDLRRSLDDLRARGAFYGM